MAKLNNSKRLFAGMLVFFAEEVAATSDLVTKPAADNAAWKEVGCVSVCKHVPKQFEQEYSCPDPARGWIDRKEVFTVADMFELTTEEVSELYHRLAMGVEAALVVNTPQTPFAQTERMVRGWVKFQKREHGGSDRDRNDLFCEIRLKEDPATEKKSQVPQLELFVLHSTLNSYVLTQ